MAIVRGRVLLKALEIEQPQADVGSLNEDDIFTK